MLDCNYKGIAAALGIIISCHGDEKLSARAFKNSPIFINKYHAYRAFKKYDKFYRSSNGLNRISPPRKTRPIKK